jgi:hypothetical protein
MVNVKTIILDVLKPHQPDGLVFATAVAEQTPGCRVSLSVLEVDEKTESISLRVEGDNISYEAIAAAITGMGATVHSIDEVEAVNVKASSEPG